MTDTATALINKPAWVDLATTDQPGAEAFYTKLFGWQTEVNPDPQYGGYALARLGGQDVAGIGRVQSPDQPPAWTVYIGADDAEAIGRKVEAAGGTVVVPALEIPGQGRMAVFQDPSGAFIAAWQATAMRGFQTGGANAFSWAELNARGVERVLPFYEQLFGWTPRTTDTGGQRYTEFQLDGESIAGATEISSMAPAEMPSYWLVYFGVDDVDRAFRAALEGGAREMLSPIEFPGGRLALVSDPQGAIFGLLQMAEGG
jgi:uncharacterized protein